MPNQKAIYLFSRGERGISAEIFFPKKVIHQGAVYDALRDGLKAETTKASLRTKASELFEELKYYKGLFDPHQYERDKKVKIQPTLQEAIQRINMYESFFKGWSMSEVDGVWVSDEGEIYDERTQVIRLMFRLPSVYTKEAINADCFDCLRSMLFWCIESQGNLDEHVKWGKAEENRFINHHRPWPKHKLAFVRRYFKLVAKEVSKWRDDCALLIFGHLVKKFSESVLKEGVKEQVIWVTSFFNLTINETQRVELFS